MRYLSLTSAVVAFLNEPTRRVAPAPLDASRAAAGDGYPLAWLEVEVGVDDRNDPPSLVASCLPRGDASLVDGDDASTLERGHASRRTA